MEIQNLLSSVLNSDNIGNGDLLSRIKIGDVLKAKVLDMIGDTITLQINDKLTIEAKDISKAHYNIGDILEFTIADMEADKIFIKSNISKNTLLEGKLFEAGINLNEENKDLIELLFKNQIPITKENISVILSTKKYYGKLIDFIKDNNIQINSETINNDIKDTLKTLIQNNESIVANKTNQNEDVKTMFFQNQDNANSNLPFINELVNGEGKLSLEKLIFMMKNNLDFNAKDIILVNNLLSGEKTITSQIENLIRLLDDNLIDNNINIAKNIESNSNTKNIENIDNIDKNIQIKDLKNKLTNILNKFEISNLKEKENFKLIMKELYESFEEIKNSTLNSETRGVLNKHIEEIKASFDFVNKLNENMAFIQMPIYINNSLKNLDIYIKKDSKSSKKINPNNTKIFISLNTNSLDTVQVLVELNKKDINLNFKVCDERIKKVIKNSEKLLSDKLKEYDFNNVIIKYSISTEKQNLTDVVLNENKIVLNTLDIRV